MCSSLVCIGNAQAPPQVGVDFSFLYMLFEAENAHFFKKTRLIPEFKTGMEWGIKNGLGVSGKMGYEKQTLLRK